MASMVSTLVGGIGLFLVGMILLTEGMKAFAGDSLRRFLARFTGGRISALLSGTALTAIVQSSSATTLATIGFVSAGLIGFEQAVGVILGANLGTTSTGWLVSALGLKFSVTKVALPLVGVGALLRLVARGRWAHLGFALAGFGLIFVGIDTLQLGMQSLATRLDPASLPGAGIGGRLLLGLFGALMTVVMQSSSAAMATTLTALHSGSIDPTQAAALVIGQNVGTTVTAGLGSIGASAPAKRTALAHVLFNLVTGVLAFLLLPLLVSGIQRGGRWLGVDDGALQLAAFHTVFNVLGVCLFLPVLGGFARLLNHLVPERGPHLTRLLGPMVAKSPLAVDAAVLTARAILEELLTLLRRRLSPERPAHPAERRERVLDALRTTREFLAGVPSAVQLGERHYARHVSLMHVLDHLDRLAEAAGESPGLERVLEAEEVRVVHAKLVAAVHAAREALRADASVPHSLLEDTSRAIAAERKRSRPHLLTATAQGKLPPIRGATILETVRWLDRLAYHLWRVGEHLIPADPAGIAQAVLPEGPTKVNEDDDPPPRDSPEPRDG